MFKKNFKSIEIVKAIKQLNIGKTVQTSSDHKIADVKQTDLRKVGRNNTVRIKSEIEATCNSTISCLDRDDFGCYSIELSSI